MIRTINYQQLFRRGASTLPLALLLASHWQVPGAIALSDARLPSVSTTSSPRPPLTEDPYLLGGGDLIRIDVFQLPQYSGEFEVLVDGVVGLPVVGSVAVEGLTLEQATEQIREQYSQILHNPKIGVTLLSRRALQVAISGEVNRPGSYTLLAQSSEFPTLTQALEEAGGIRLSADISRVQVIRQRFPSTYGFTVDLQQLLNEGNLASDITLRDGDQIIIPTAEAPDLATLAAMTNASFAAAETSEINIAIVGEVFRPGPHVVTGSAQTGDAGETGQAQNRGRFPTVTSAIQVAGGIKPLADVRNVQVRRPTRQGSTQVIDVNLWALLQDGDLNQDVVLQDGDTVIVPTAPDIVAEDAAQLAAASFSPDSIRVQVVGEVERPGVIEIPPNTPLNQALLAAGGFNKRARRRSVDLIRLNPNGTVAARELPVDFEQGIDEELNPALQNNDVVVVGRSSITRVSDTLATIGEPVGRFVNLVTSPFALIRLLE